MHGYADVTSALVWIQADVARPDPHLVARGRRRRRADDDAGREGSGGTGGRRPTHRACARRGRASYRIEGDGDVREGSVRAQPAWRDAKSAPDITIAIGSCFFLSDPNPLLGSADYAGGFEIFDAIAAKKPDLMLWLGDNLYFQRPDFLDPVAMAARHRRQRAFEPLSRLLTATAHIAIWDDHDFGWNNADGSYPLKGEALRLFKLYWANPSFGLPEVPGVFGFAMHGDVDLVLTDGRYYRSHPRLADSPPKTMFGATQLEWLKGMLLNARGAVKIVASGSQLWNAASRFDGLYQFPTEAKALADFLLAQRIDGLLFVSGDRHFTELLRGRAAGCVSACTSSPRVHSPRDPGRIPTRGSETIRRSSLARSSANASSG